MSATTNAIDPSLLCSGGVESELWGPDLDALPTLADQIATLDAAASEDVEHYVSVWLSISDQNGGGASAFWGNDDAADAPAQLTAGVLCDRQEGERRMRWKALRDHHAGIEGFRPAMQRELVRQGRFVDNRKVGLVEIKAVVRAFLGTGGRLLIAPKATRRRAEPIEAMPDTKRFAHGPWSDADAVAAVAMFRIAQRWRARIALTRIVRTLGATENGWIVLEGARS